MSSAGAGVEINESCKSPGVSRGGRVNAPASSDEVGLKRRGSIWLTCISYTEGCLLEIDGIKDRLEAYGYRIQVSGDGSQGHMMVLRHPCHDLAIVVANALRTNSRLFLLAFGTFGCGVLAMATATCLAHLMGIIWREILATSLDGTSAKRRVGGGEGGRRLKVDVIWVVAHPDAGLGQDVLAAERGRSPQQRRRDFPLRSYNYPLAAKISAILGNPLGSHLRGLGD